MIKQKKQDSYKNKSQPYLVGKSNEKVKRQVQIRRRIEVWIRKTNKCLSNITLLDYW